MATNSSPSDFAGGRGARWFTAVAIAGTLLAIAFWLWPRPEPVRTATAATPDHGEPDTAPPPWSAVDEAEMRRLNKLGYFDGDTVEVFLVGTVHGELDTIPQLIEDLLRDAVLAGAGSRAIYPALPADSVYVVAGPHRPDNYFVDSLALREAARVRFSSIPRPVRLVLRDGDPPWGGQPSRVAQAEYRRLWWEGKMDWAELPVRVAGVFPESELARAGERLRWVRAAGLESGIADRTVYPQLDAGTVAVIIGPYREERMAWAARRIPRLERMWGEPFRPRTLSIRDVRELGGWTPVDSAVPPAPPFRHYDWMDRP